MNYSATKCIGVMLLLGVLLPTLFLVALPHEVSAAEIDVSKSGLRETEALVQRACTGWNPLSWIDLNCIILNTIWLVDKFLISTVLKLATVAFDTSLSFALQDVTKSPFVDMGWGIVRDVSNLFFIFILLWIALATIFDIPQYGAKALLGTLIAAALLINFSLAIGGFFINFSNALGRAFYAPIQGSAGQFLLKFTDFQIPATQKIDPESLTPGDQNIICKNNAATATCKTSAPGTEEAACLTDSIYRQCIKDASVAAGLKARQDERGAIIDATYVALWLVIIIPVLAFVFFAGALFFLIRYLMLSFLLVFAPIVFLLWILPATRGIWNDWWGKLIQWSFFAPAFFFLLFLTIFTFEEVSKTFVGASQGFIATSFTMILFVALMIMNLMVAQKMGIQGAGTVIGWGSRAAGWTGKQIRGAAYRGAVRGAEPLAKGVTESRLGRFMARTPGLRAMTQQVTEIQKERERLDEERAGQIERAATVSPDLALARLKGESMGVKAAFTKSASPENMRKLMEKMPKEDQEEFVHNLHANKDKYRIEDLDKKVGEATKKDANGLTLRVIAKSGTRTSDPNFQAEVNKYLDGMTDRELSDAMTAKTISGNAYAAEYLKKNFKNEQRIGRATLGTPEKIDSFLDAVERIAKERPNYATEIAGVPEEQQLKKHIDWAASAMDNAQNPEGAKALRFTPMLKVLAGGSARQFVTERKKRKEEEAREEKKRPSTILAAPSLGETQEEYEERRRLRGELGR